MWPHSARQPSRSVIHKAALGVVGMRGRGSGEAICAGSIHSAHAGHFFFFLMEKHELRLFCDHSLQPRPTDDRSSAATPPKSLVSDADTPPTIARSIIMAHKCLRQTPAAFVFIRGLTGMEDHAASENVDVFTPYNPVITPS